MSKLDIFLAVGLSEKTAKEVSTNAKLSEVLLSDLKTAGVTQGCDKSIGNLLYHVATKLPPKPDTLYDLKDPNREFLLKSIASRELKTNAQVDAAIELYKKSKKSDFNPAEKESDKVKFRSHTGVGVSFTPSDIDKVIRKVLEDNKDALKVERYRLVPKLLPVINKELKWGDGRLIKEQFDAELLKVLGPRTEDDSKPLAKPAPSPSSSSSSSSSSISSVPPSTPSSPPPPSAPADDFLVGRYIPTAENTEVELKGHKDRLRNEYGRENMILTRFPPEPNGFLHIGHAKAMNFNFGIARKHEGLCILRFDDTNPEAEKKLYIDNIIENVTWLMGMKPKKITYSSDYFQELYDFAIKLIKKGKAYVCHQTKAEIKQFRDDRKDSPYRNRTVEENLRLFDDMRRGKFAEGKAILRVKGNMQDVNPNMWDFVAYRIKYTRHPHVGDKWCIYPSYDYTHCIIDSLEDIAYSLCTLEFEIRRESYFWLLWELEIYKPKVWEYSRLNIEHNQLSKRRLLRLVKEKYVSGWDDPRLLTLNGLRRRGYTAEAINTFCSLVGVTRGENYQSPVLLEHCARDALENISKRALVVLDPVEVTLVNFPADKVEIKTAPDFPFDVERGSHEMPFTNKLYIDRKDFRSEDSKDYFGLAPGKEVHLKYAYNIKCVEFKQNSAGQVTEIKATVDLENKTKCKGKINWVARVPGKEPLTVELRQYNYLLLSDSKTIKDKNYKDWTEDLNPDSLQVVTALADPSIANAKYDSAKKEGDHFQFERVGYYVVDPDSTPRRLVFNRTVKLKDKLKKVK